MEMFKLKGGGEEDQKVRKSVATWWEQNKGSDEVQWAKDALASGSTTWAGGRYMGIDSLYLRLGKESYPFLAKAYRRLPKGHEDADSSDATTFDKIQILQRLLDSPTANEKEVFISAVHDAPLEIRINGAEGLQAIGDDSGLKAMVKETEDRLLKDFGSSSLDSEYRNLVSFFVRCNTQRSRETVYKCLNGRNPYLREKAIAEVPSLHLEKAIRALSDLFDDPFVLCGSYRSYDGKTERIVPPRRVCDEAAETFNKVVPDAPHVASKKPARNMFDRIHRDIPHKPGVAKVPARMNLRGDAGIKRTNKLRNRGSPEFDKLAACRCFWHF